MRVLLVHNGWDLYGASRSLLRLASRLSRDGHAVRAILTAPGPLAEALAAARVGVGVDPGLAHVERQQFRSPMAVAALPLRVGASVRRLTREIRGYRPDVVHSNTALVLAGGPAARACRVPHVWHVREFFSEFSALWPAYRAFMLASTDVIVCVSNAVAAQFGGRGAGRLRVLHNGFPRDEFLPVNADRVAVFRQRWGLGDAPAVGVIGRIKTGRKGQDVFVRAAALLAPNFPTAKFVLVGSPYPGNETHLAAVIDLARSLGIADRLITTGDVGAGRCRPSICAS
jgi:glycosyltransferase involved in cell wall biosynthesis